MWALTRQHTFYFYGQPADMRKGFDGLSHLVRQDMKANPLDGSVYIFVNRRRNRMKILVWEAGGFIMYYKRLEQGTFELPGWENTGPKIIIGWETLMMIVSGLSLPEIKRRKRYKRA